MMPATWLNNVSYVIEIKILQRKRTRKKGAFLRIQFVHKVAGICVQFIQVIILIGIKSLLKSVFDFNNCFK